MFVCVNLQMKDCVMRHTAFFCDHMACLVRAVWHTQHKYQVCTDYWHFPKLLPPVTFPSKVVQSRQFAHAL